MSASPAPASYTVRLDTFEGPLDLLLRLVEAEQLSLTDIRLASVTEAFLQEVRVRAENTAYPIEELAHFLVVASKLVALKARLLAPGQPQEDEEEESLLARLQAYQGYIRAGEWLRSRMDGGALLFSRGAKQEVMDEILPHPPTHMQLHAALRALFARSVAPAVPPRPVLLERLVTIEDRMAALRERLAAGRELSLFSWVGKEASREMRLVSFLAVLELVRLRSVRADQSTLFEDVTLSSL